MRFILIAFFAMIFSEASGAEMIKLPQPKYDSNFSIERTLLQRRSIRLYEDAPLTLADVSQLLWAAQGITENGWRLTRHHATELDASVLQPLIGCLGHRS